MNRKIVLGLTGLLVIAAGWWCYSRWNLGAWRPALSSRELATRVLASHLAQRFPGSKVLVFGNPFILRPGQNPEIYEFEQAAIRGLSEGFGTSMPLKVVYPSLRPQALQQPQSVFVDPRTTTPLSFLVAEDAFDRLLEENPGCDVAVSLIGLPVGIRERPAWRDRGRPHFGLLLPDWRLIGAPPVIAEAFHSGKIAAAVINRPGASAAISPEGFRSDVQAEFNRLFLLVTPENVDDLLGKFPRAF
jgi:hypothetical protein